MFVDELLVIKGILEEAGNTFGYRICEDIPASIEAIVAKHPEWAIEFHEWNGDPEVVELGETINQITTLTYWARLKIERMIKDVS